MQFGQVFILIVPKQRLAQLNHRGESASKSSSGHGAHNSPSASHSGGTKPVRYYPILFPVVNIILIIFIAVQLATEWIFIKFVALGRIILMSTRARSAEAWSCGKAISKALDQP